MTFEQLYVLSGREVVGSSRLNFRVRRKRAYDHQHLLLANRQAPDVRRRIEIDPCFFSRSCFVRSRSFALGRLTSFSSAISEVKQKMFSATFISCRTLISCRDKSRSQGGSRQAAVQLNFLAFDQDFFPHRYPKDGHRETFQENRGCLRRFSPTRGAILTCACPQTNSGRLPACRGKSLHVSTVSII